MRKKNGGATEADTVDSVKVAGDRIALTFKGRTEGVRVVIPRKQAEKLLGQLQEKLAERP